MSKSYKDNQDRQKWSRKRKKIGKKSAVFQAFNCIQDDTVRTVGAEMGELK